MFEINLQKYPEFDFNGFDIRRNVGGKRYDISIVINDIFGITNKNDWVNHSEEEDLETYCLCGKDIKTLYNVRHKESGIIVGLGSSCINQFCPDLYTKIKNGCCLMCNDAIPQKRFKYNREGFCTTRCKEVYIVEDWICYNDLKKRLWKDIPLDYLKYIKNNHTIKNNLVASYLKRKIRYYENI